MRSDDRSAFVAGEVDDLPFIREALQQIDCLGELFGVKAFEWVIQDDDGIVIRIHRIQYGESQG